MFKCFKGINLGGWLSQCNHLKEHYDSFIKEEDFEKIKKLGFDHVRIPIDYEVLETEDGEYKHDGFAYLDKCIEWSKKNELDMILDLHKTYGFSFIGEETDFFYDTSKRKRFLKLWNELAKRYAQYSDFLSFELLNEVVDGKVINEWNSLIDEAIKTIRKYSNDIYIIIGGVFYNSIFSVKYLPLFEDRNIVYTFHCYEPICFTHQGAYWVKGMPTDYRVQYPVSMKELYDCKEYLPAANAIIFDKYEVEEMDKDFFEVIFDEAINFAEQNNLQLYCGEYGVIDLANPNDALNWYKKINASFVKHNIGRAVWSYKQMDFGIIDDHYKDVFDELLKYL